MCFPPVCVVLAIALALITASPAAAQDLVPPVDGSVTDPFRAPQHFAGPGNRGLEYGRADGSQVVASDDGRVSFAGSVAGRHVVSVVHAGGFRTTYTDVRALAVTRGETVRRGQTLALAGDRFHFGLVQAGVYLDPAPFFRSPTLLERSGGVRLVPPRRLGS